MDNKNGVKSYIVCESVTMMEIAEKLTDERGWRESIANLMGKLLLAGVLE